MQIIKLAGILLFCIILLLGGCVAVFSVGNYTNTIKFDLQLKDEKETSLKNLPVIMTGTWGGKDTLYTDDKGHLKISTQQSSTIVGLFYLFGRKVKPSYPIKMNLYFPSLNKNFYVFCFNKTGLSSIEFYNKPDYNDSNWAGSWENNRYVNQKFKYITYQGKSEKILVEAKKTIEKPILWQSDKMNMVTVGKDKTYYYQIDADLTLLKNPL